MELVGPLSENSPETETVPTTYKLNSQAGFASLLLTVIELVRQLMEAQVIRRMEQQLLSESDLDKAAESLKKLEEEELRLCEIFEIDPEDLNVDLGELGTLLPPAGTYYPGEASQNPSVLELVDRLINIGLVVHGDVDLGLANINLIHAKLRLVVTSKPL